mmetsp:Transcript_39227/g.112818  ORF Transcript_39227/g.112818 Transcript_39227/m.112818 type:complete len:226 (+) Transcript_39227:1126-1803(+)
MAPRLDCLSSKNCHMRRLNVLKGVSPVLSLRPLARGGRSASATAPPSPRPTTTTSSRPAWACGIPASVATMTSRISANRCAARDCVVLCRSPASAGGPHLVNVLATRGRGCSTGRSLRALRGDTARSRSADPGTPKLMLLWIELLRGRAAPRSAGGFFWDARSSTPAPTSLGFHTEAVVCLPFLSHWSMWSAQYSSNRIMRSPRCAKLKAPVSPTRAAQSSNIAA